MAKSRSFGGIVFIAIVAVLAGGGWYWWHLRAQKGVEYFTAPASRGELVQSVTATGIIQPVLDVLVSSQISGYVTSLSADFNSKVKKGDLLCTLLPTNYEAAVNSAQGDLANAQANLELQQVNEQRQKALLDKHLVAQSDYDQALALLHEAAAQVQIKTASLATARANLSYCRIVSPIDGIVIKRSVDIGNSVAATLSSPTLFEIANDLTKMQIDASVSEADIGNVAEKQQVNFSVDAYPNRQFRGTVFQIRNAPNTQQNVVIYDVMISVDNSDLRLKPGMTANASIIVARRPNALRAPNGALRFRLPDGIAFTPAAEPAAASGAAPAAPAAPKKQLSPDEQRAAFRQLMQEVGFQRGSPPTPEQLQKLKDLAQERGIEIPERMMAFLGGGGRRGQGGDAPVFRTFYVLPAGAGPEVKPQQVRVQVGITDGANTEILKGDLKDGDQLITGVNQPNEANRPAGGASPFGGGGGGGGRRGF